MAGVRFDIILAPQAVEDFERLRAVDRAKVKDAIEKHLRHEPGRVSRSRIKRLRGSDQPQFRLRIDDVRVFYDMVERQVRILAIVPKADAAAWLEKVGKSS